MTVGSVNNVCSPRIVPERAMKGLGNSIHLIEMHNREGAARLPSAPCRSSYTIGPHEQRAHADAISVSYDVGIAAREAASKPRHRAALDKSLGHIGSTPQQAYGPRVMNQLTVLGAVLASARHAAQASPDNPGLVECQRKLESAIVKIELKAGACRGIATGGYHGDSESLRLTEALAQGQDAIVHSREVMGDSVLLDGIVSAVLPGAMMQSLRERMPDVAASYQGRMQELDFSQVLQKQYADATWSSVEHQMQTGCPEAFANAVFALLKLPQYVMEGTPDSGGPDQPTGAPVPEGRFPPIPAMPAGGNQAINQNIVDNREFGKAAAGFNETLKSIANLSQRDCFELGKEQGRLLERNGVLSQENAGLRSQNADLTNANTDLQNKYDDLARRFEEAQQRLNSWNGTPTDVVPTEAVSSQTDSGNASQAGDDQVDGSSIPNHNEENAADLEAAAIVSESIESLLNAASHSDQVDGPQGVEGDLDDEALELLRRLQALRNPTASAVASADNQRSVVEETLQSSADQVNQKANGAANGTGSPQMYSEKTMPVVPQFATTSGLSNVAKLTNHFEQLQAAADKATRHIRARPQASSENVQPAATRQGRRDFDYSALRSLPPATLSPRPAVTAAVAANSSAHPASRQTSVAEAPNMGIRAEYDALLEFRTGQGRQVSPVEKRDDFRAAFVAKGGPEYRPVVPPRAPAKEEIVLRGNELERVFDAFNQARSMGSTSPLRETFGPINDRGPKVERAEAWASSDDGSDSEPATAPGSGLDENWHLQAPVARVPPAKGLFERESAVFHQRHNTAAVLKSLMGGS